MKKALEVIERVGVYGLEVIAYVALIFFPYGFGFFFMTIAQELFGEGIISILSSVAGIVLGIVLGGMFGFSDTFHRIIDSFSAAAPQKECSLKTNTNRDQEIGTGVDFRRQLATSQ